MLLTDYLVYKEGGLYWTTSDRSKKAGNRVGVINHEGYRVFGFNGKQLKEHREVFYLHNGYYPDQIDHINGVRDDNRPENLRPVTNCQNQYNRSDVKGWRKARKGFEARISYEGVRKSLGYFNCPTAAHLAYVQAAKALYKEFWSRSRYSLNKKNENVLTNQAN